jgi:hypothetical protein
MRLFLDTEFNGFGGKLISMALVPEDKSAPEFYKELEIKDQLEPWVRDNVVPHLFLAQCSFSEFQTALSTYLLSIKNYTTAADSYTIIADWPDDIRYFCEALITGPGMRINVPMNIKFELDLNIEYESVVPHNALHDARAIRDFYKEKFKFALKNRYGVGYRFRKLTDNSYTIEGNLDYWRFGGREGQNQMDMTDLGFADPSGGPFISIGYVIDGRTVKRIGLINEKIIFGVE